MVAQYNCGASQLKRAVSTARISGEQSANQHEFGHGRKKNQLAVRVLQSSRWSPSAIWKSITVGSSSRVRR